jgi:hypothetical protein
LWKRGLDGSEQKKQQENPHASNIGHTRESLSPHLDGQAIPRRPGVGTQECIGNRHTHEFSE